MSSALENWIATHPYLREVAEFQQKIDEAFAGLSAPSVAAPNWNDVLAEYRAGTPLLENAAADLDFAGDAGEMLLQACEALLRGGEPKAILPGIGALRDHLARSEDNRKLAIGWVLNGDPGAAPVKPEGLLRVLGWRAVTASLAPVLGSYAERRTEDEWRRAYCPVCGALPAMAMLQKEQPRTLACCYCRTTWEYQRIGCPFCQNDDPDQLKIYSSAEEPLFRLDTCDECHGYLKTYLGGEDLELYLSDWSTLHLDLLAKQHGLDRKAAPLLET